MVVRYLIVIAALLAVALGTPVEVQICGGSIDSRYLPQAVRTSACNDDNQCFISLSGETYVEIDATTPFATSSLSVHGYMHFSIPDELEAVIPVPFPDEIMDGCAGLISGSCPLGEREDFTSRITWTFSPETEIEVGSLFDLQLRIYDENETIVSCFRVPIEVIA